MTLALVLLLACLLLGLAALLLVLFAARSRARRKQFVPVAEGEHRVAAARQAGAARRLAMVARQAVSSLSAVLPDSAQSYALPMVVLAGDAGAGKTAVMNHAGLSMAAAVSHDHGGELSWYNFNQGLVLEVGGSYLGLDGPPGESYLPWKSLCMALQRYRPRRPIDAVIVAVSVEVLRGSDEERDQHAGNLQRRLADMQSLFGLRLPVYVLVTKADLLPDFAAFAAALPAPLHAGMLGWSNPDGAGQPFEPGAVRDAFAAIGATINELSNEIMGGHAPQGVREGFFAFAPALAALQPAMQAYLARLMSSQGEPVQLRGLYFSGSADSGAHQPRPVFIHDLLAAKVFGERALAQPLRGQMLSRDRRARFWRTATAALILVWLPMLVLADRRLASMSGELVSTLNVIQEEADKRATVNRKGEHLEFAWYQAAAGKMAQAMLGESSLVAYAIPFSWHGIEQSGLDAKIDEAFTRGISYILLPTINKGFNRRVASMTGTPADPVTTKLLDPSACRYTPRQYDPGFGPYTRVAELDAFKDLSAYADNVATLGAHLDQFARLQGSASGTLQDLAELGSYTNAFTIDPQKLGADAGYFRRALHKFNSSKPLSAPSDYDQTIACAMQARHAALMTRLLDRHPLRQLAQNIDSKLHAQTPAHADGREFDRLQAELHQAAQWLGAPGTDWIHARRSDIDKPYADLMARLPVRGLVDKELADHLREQMALRLIDFDAQLREALDPSSPVLQRNADGTRIVMTAPVARMEHALSSLMAQPYMAVPPARVARSGESDRAMSWDLNRLNRLLVMTADEQAYLGQSLGAFPVSMQNELRQFADARLAANVLAGIDAAQTPASEPMAAWVSLGQSQKVLVALLDALDRLGASAQRRQLAEVISAQAGTALAGLNAAFESQAVYLPKNRDFGWWSGSRNPAAQAFAGGDPAALDDYLAAQHDLVERSARLVRPLLRLVQDGDGDGAARQLLVQRWTSITRELDRFADKAPGARIAALHAYIRTDLTDTDQLNCQGRALPAAANDFFAMRTRELGERLAVRCVELTRSGGSSAYADLASQFRATLAGKFPFALARDEGGMAAEPDDVAAFFQAWDRSSVQAQRLLVRMGEQGGPAVQRVRPFLSGAERARAFLAPLQPLDAAEEPGYDLRVRFRVNERGEGDGNNALAGEVEGNRIAEWTLQVGDQVQRFRNGEQGEGLPLRWRIGMPVLLTLRWAENAPSLPRADDSDPHMRVAGREVRFQFSEPWSLLRMLGRYRVAGARGETLRLDVPLAAGAPVPSARVFLRLAISPANKKVALAYPPFPVEAPPFEQTIYVRAKSPAAAPGPHLATGGSR